MSSLPLHRVPWLHEPAALIRRGAEWAVLLTLGCALSWVSTGYVFGTNNNVYHLPIVGSLFALPQFASDPFVQSLHGFSSGLWMLLVGSARVIDPVLLFAALLLLSKALSLLGMTLIAQELGLTGTAQRAGFIAVVALMPVLQGHAFAGHGGLFMNYGTHSELANGFVLLMLWACFRQRFGAALALSGVVFFLNAFMAVWAAVPLLWLWLRATRIDSTLWRRQRAALVWGAAAAALLAAPVLVRTLGFRLASGDSAPFDYRAFLLDLYPYHFLASAMPAGQWLGLAAVAGAAVLGIRSIGEPARPLAHALAGFGVVYAVGIVLPLLSLAPALLNLHLLRVSVFAHLIAGIVMGVVIVQGFASGAPQRRWLVAPWLLLCVLLPRIGIAGTLALPLLQRVVGAVTRPAGLALVKLAGIGLLLGTAISVAFTTQRTWQNNEQLRRSVADWASLAQQIERTTAPEAVVLLPFETDSWQPANAGAGVFEYHGRRQVWADRKRGAAVLWQPAYHAEWRRRTDGQAALQSWEDSLRYATAHGIDVVVGLCDTLLATTVAARLAEAGPLCALRAPKGAR